MKKNILFLLISIPLFLHAQQGVVATGGDAEGPGGTIRSSTGLSDFYVIQSEQYALQHGLQHACKDFKKHALTLNLDMSFAPGFDPEADLVYVTGTFTDFWPVPGSDPDNQLMTRVDQTMIWTKTLYLAEGDYEYKYFLNDGWDGGEWGGDPNRTIEPGGDSEINDLFGYVTFSGDGQLADPECWDATGLFDKVLVKGNASLNSHRFQESMIISGNEPGNLLIESAGSLTLGQSLINEAGVSGLVIHSGGSLIQHSEDVLARVERNIAAANWNDGTDGWHLISSPVDNQAIEDDWTPAGQGNDYDFYAWSEAEQKWLNQKLAANNIHYFIPGQAYLVSYQQGGIKAFMGELNTGDLSVSLSRTADTPYSGWNLLGNPYSCALIWNDSFWGNLEELHVGANAQIWDRSGRSYTIVAPDDIIPALNGFMVQLTDGVSSVLNIPSDSRTHHAQPWYKLADDYRIRLVAWEHGNASYQESHIVAHAESTQSFHNYHDARFLPGYAPLFYSIKDGEKLAVYSIPDVFDGLVVPFGFEKNTGEVFRIELAEGASELRLCLHDLMLDVVHPLQTGFPYGFTSGPDDDPMRFELRFGCSDITGIDDADVSAMSSVWVHENTLYVYAATEYLMLDVLDMGGRRLRSFRPCKGDHAYPLNLPPGVYVVHISEKQSTRYLKVVML